MATINSIGSNKPVSVAFGGTGASTLTSNGVLLGNGTSAITAIDAGAATTGHVLTAVNGSAPTFQAVSGGGTVDSVTGGTNLNTTGTAADPVVNLDATISLTTVNATEFNTDVATAGLSIYGPNIDAEGTADDIDIAILPKGDGRLSTTELDLSVPLAVGSGGVGVDTLLDGGLLVGATTGPIEALAVGGVGTILTGVTGSNPTWSTATYPSTAAIGTILIASGANVITTLAPSTAGHVLTDGGAGVAPSWQANADMAWNTEAGTPVQMVINNAYINQAAGLTTLTLPATAAVGSLVTLCGRGAGGWKIAQNASQEIQVGSMASTNGVGGYVASTNRYDTVSLVCCVANTTWQAMSFVGVLDVA